MTGDLPRMCIFGDSHYACLKQAEVQGLADVSGVELEYWGHVGTRFRYLAFREGAVHPVDEFTARRFAKFNAMGRMHLPAEAFDMILVMGARVYIWRLFQQVLQALVEGPFLSAGLIRRVIADGLRGQQGYRLAAGLAGTGTARVLLAPVAFYTAGSLRHGGLLTPEMAALAGDVVPVLWQVAQAVGREDGVEILAQDPQTVVEGLFTNPAFAVADHVAREDYEHHNAAFGAHVLGRVMPLARATPRRG